MRVETRFLLAGATALLSGCVAGASSSESRGSTRARYAGAVPVMLTNATPGKMCGLYMTDDIEADYGDNWLSDDGLPSGSSVTFRVKPGKYKARWDTCPEGSKPSYYAATRWREAAITVQRETQLYAFVADSVSPTRRAQVMGRNYDVVQFPGQIIDPGQPSQPPAAAAAADRSPDEPQTELRFRGADEMPRAAGFVGSVMVNAETAAQLRAQAAPPAPAARPAPAPAAKTAPAAKPAAPPAAAPPAPSAGTRP
jgi:hypothetical protein